jgi:uncharacterized protein (DUF39 family)
MTNTAKYEMVETVGGGWVVVKLIRGHEVARTAVHDEDTAARICLAARWP